MQKEIKTLILSYIIFVLVKSILVYFIPTPSEFSDGYFYSKAAREISQGNLMYIQPLYPITLSIAYIANNMEVIYFLMKFINVILSSLIIFPVYFLSREFLNHKDSIIISIIISIISAVFIFPSFIMSENLFYPLFMFTIFFLFKAFNSNTRKYFILAGIFLALSYLTRTVGAVLVLVSFLVYLFFFREIKLRNIIYLYFTALIIVLPWLIYNIKHFGFSLETLIGKQNLIGISLADKIGPFANWFILYFGYLTLASGIFFTIYFLCGIKIKEKKFKTLFLISSVTVILFLLFAANHSSSVLFSYHDSPFSLFTYRPVGRYIDTVLPLIFLVGFIVYKKNEIKDLIIKRSAIVLSIVLAISTQLTLAPLFPINNHSLSFLGTFKYVLEFLLFKKTNFDVQFYWVSFIIILLLLVSSVFILYKLRKNKKVVLFLTIFLLANSALAYSINYYNSSKYWYNGEQMQLGLWFNEYDKGKSIVLFDERYEGPILKNNQTMLYERLPSSFATISGFWMNNELRVGNVNDPIVLESVDYIITKHKLDMQLVKQTNNGIYLYKVE